MSPIPRAGGIPLAGEGRGGGGGGRGQPVAGGGTVSGRWDTDDLARRVRIVNKMYPGMKKRPKLALALARQDIPDDHLIESITKTAGWESVQRWTKQIKGLPGDQQRQLWDDYDKTTRQLIKQAGYKGPPEKAPDPGLFEQALDTFTDLPFIRVAKDLSKGHFMDALGDVPGVGGIAAISEGAGPLEVIGRASGAAQLLEAGDVGAGVADMVGHVGGEALRNTGLGEVAGVMHSASAFGEEVMGKGLDVANLVGSFPKQMMRLDYELGNQQNAGLPSLVKPLDYENPSVELNTESFNQGVIGGSVNALTGLITGDEKKVEHFLDAWEKTAVGERYFPDASVAAASDILEDDPYSLEAARQLAGGSSIEDIASRYAEPGTPKYQEEYLNLLGLTGTKSFSTALRTLENSKMSLGRNITRDLGIPVDSGPGTVLSGATDAVVTWYTDPLLIAGKIRHAYKAREAISSMPKLLEWQAYEAKALDAVHGSDWQAKLAAGELTVEQIGKTAKRYGTAAEIAEVIGDTASRYDSEALYNFFHARFPQFEKGAGALIDWHNELQGYNIRAAAKEKGGLLTVEEAAEIPGIQNADDVWEFYRTNEGFISLSSGNMQPGVVDGNFFIPALSRTSRLAGDVRGAMTRTIDDLASRGLGVSRGLNEPVYGGVEGMRAAAAELPEVEEGFTRLYRVQAGTELFGPLKYGRETDLRIWHNNIERSRQAGLGLGRFGQFGYIDVSNAEIKKLEDVTEEWHKLIEASPGVPITDYKMPLDFEITPKVIGPVGDFAEIGGKVRPTAGGLLAAPARFTQLLMARVPEGTSIAIHDRDTATQLARLLDMEYGMAPSAKARMYGEILMASNDVMKREMIRSVIDRLHYANGAYIDDTGKAAAEPYIAGITQRYAIGDQDKMPVGNQSIPFGIGPYVDHADHIQLPDFKELARQSRRMGVLHKMLGPSQIEMWDAVMGKAWKPAMLFRLGFAPRAAAEEAIVTLLRAPHVYTQGALLRLAKAGGEPVVTYRDMSRLAKGLEIYMPGDVARSANMHPLDKFAHVLGNTARGWVQGMATDALDKQVLDGARYLAEFPAYQHAMFEGMTRVGGTRSAFGLPEQVRGSAPRPFFQFPINAAGATELRAARAMAADLGKDVELISSKNVATTALAKSDFVVYDGANRLGMFHYAAQHWIEDPVQRALTEGRSLFINDMQAEMLRGFLEHRGIEGVTSHSIVRQAREAIQENAEFAGTYRKYISVKRRADEPEAVEFLHGRLNEIAVASGDRRLMAVADAAAELPSEVQHTLLLNKNNAMKMLQRPELEIDLVDRAMFGPHLGEDADEYINQVLSALPEVEPGLMRVYGRVGAQPEEEMAAATVRRAWEDLPAEQQPWKYVTADPDDLAKTVLNEADAAAKGGPTHTQKLFYADVDPKELLEDGNRLFLQESHRPAQVFFGDAIGTQLTDMGNWARGVDGDRARWWSQLADEALDGNATSARQLGMEMAKRQLQHPNTMRNTREMMRGNMTRDGRMVQKPVADGMTPIYYVTLKPAEAEDAFLAVDRESAVGRRFLAGRQDPPPQNVAAYESMGDGPHFAHSSFASSDSEEIRQLVLQIERTSDDAGKQLSVGMARVDMPEQEVKNYYKNVPGAGEYDFRLRYGDSLNGTPIDLDGKLVGGGDSGLPFGNGASFDEALEDWADVMNGHFEDLFTSEGRVVHELTVPGVQEKQIDPTWVFGEKPPPIPSQVVGPEIYVPQNKNLVGEIMRKGFDATVTPLTNALSRNPLFIHNALKRIGFAEKNLRPMLADETLVEAAMPIARKLGYTDTKTLYNNTEGLPTKLDEVREMTLAGTLPKSVLKLSPREFDTLFEFRKNEKMVRQTIGETASRGAINDTLPFIDDHNTRSQMADEIRNLVPFWWAQEAFFRRWAKTIAHSPEAIRKAQLIMQGARHVGVVYKDEEGQDSFLIPGSNELMTVLNVPISLLLGGPVSMPIPVGISGQVRLATPGFDAVGVPGFGPLVGVPLAILRRLYPDVELLERGILGERGAGRNELEHLFPSWAVRSVQALLADPESDTTNPQVASATISAMQYLEANGHGLKPNATAPERQTYIDRVSHWARSMLVTRALVSFVDPAPAQLEIGQPEVSAEFIKLMKNLGIEEALSEMVKRHPDATAYSIFSTKSVAGAMLPATEKAQEFMQNNKDFIKKYKFAASWMLPQSSDVDSNVRSVYAMQKELGLRETKTPEEWYGDFKFGIAADTYFNSKDDYEKERERLTSSKARAAYDKDWQKWKNKYFDQHPMFADQLQTRQGEERRKTVLDEMRLAFADPKLPQFDHKKELKTLVDSYDGYLHEMNRWKGKTGAAATEFRKEFRKDFAQWAKTYTFNNPETMLFYQRVIFPDLDLTARERERFDTGPSSTTGELTKPLVNR